MGDSDVFVFTRQRRRFVGVSTLQRWLTAPSPQGVVAAVAELQLGSDDNTTDLRLTSLLVPLVPPPASAPEPDNHKVYKNTGFYRPAQSYCTYNGTYG